MKYTEAVYKRKRRGKVIYDGVLTYYDDEGARRFLSYPSMAGQDTVIIDKPADHEYISSV